MRLSDHRITHRKDMKNLLIIASAVLFLAGCTPPTPRLTVINTSSSTLTNVEAFGSGFSQPIGSLAPGAQHRDLVHPVPRDNPGFKLEFDVDGKHFSEANPTQSFRGMKEVIMTVTPAFTVTYESVTIF